MLQHGLHSMVILLGVALTKPVSVLPKNDPAALLIHPSDTQYLDRQSGVQVPAHLKPPALQIALHSMASLGPQPCNPMPRPCHKSHLEPSYFGPIFPALYSQLSSALTTLLNLMTFAVPSTPGAPGSSDCPTQHFVTDQTSPDNHPLNLSVPCSSQRIWSLQPYALLSTAHLAWER